MDADCKCTYNIVIYYVITVNYCECILLYSPLNSYHYVHLLLEFKYIIIINKLTQMAPARVRTITTAAYELVDTDQEFTLSELEKMYYIA